uniref:Uncharacterized protein n=1 Tax=Arion vulgaris TaxID=1028688 RepID=A0A0B7A275_9EUPU
MFVFDLFICPVRDVKCDAYEKLPTTTEKTRDTNISTRKKVRTEMKWCLVP